MFPSRFMPCPDCGGSVDRVDVDPHTCDPARLADYQLFTMRDEIAELELRFRQYVDTREGRFETWVASRTVRRT